MSLVYHFLVEVRFEELNLAASVFYGTVHYFPSALTRSAATHDMRILLLQAFKKRIVSAHKIYVFFAVVFPYQINDTAEVFGLIALGFYMNIHNTMAGKFLQNILKGGNLHTRKIFAALCTEIELTKLCERVLPYLAGTV